MGKCLQLTLTISVIASYKITFWIFCNLYLDIIENLENSENFIIKHILYYVCVCIHIILLYLFCNIDDENKEDSSELKIQINILENQKEELSQKLEKEVISLEIF